MIQITMTDQELEAFLDGKEWFLSGHEPGFDPWEQDTGRSQVMINGLTAEVFVEVIEPSCSCCRSDRSSCEWAVSLVDGIRYFPTCSYFPHGP